MQLACHSLDWVCNLVGSIIGCVASVVISSLFSRSIGASHHQVVLGISLGNFVLHKIVLEDIQMLYFFDYGH